LVKSIPATTPAREIDHRRPAAWDAEGHTHVSSVRGVPGTVRCGLDRLEVFLDHDAADERCATLGGPRSRSGNSAYSD
jgi:hypothetical protein